MKLGPEEIRKIRIAIAEYCGFNVKAMMAKYQTNDLDYFLKRPGQTDNIPDYYRDLNAMHEAEETLNPAAKPCLVSDSGIYAEVNEKWGRYIYKLLKICQKENTSSLHANAAQRARAFYEVINEH